MIRTDPNELLPNGLSRETTIRRDARGKWFNDGEPITHDKLTASFDEWIDRTDDGRYCLKNDVNWAYIDLEGAPIFVRGLARDGERVALSLSDGRHEPLDPATLRAGDDGRLYCDVRDGTLTAELSNHAACQLADFLEEHDGAPQLRLGEVVFSIPVVQNPVR